jgi:hypothetical protein
VRVLGFAGDLFACATDGIENKKSELRMIGVFQGESNSELSPGKFRPAGDAFGTAGRLILPKISLNE